MSDLVKRPPCFATLRNKRGLFARDSPDYLISEIFWVYSIIYNRRSAGFPSKNNGIPWSPQKSFEFPQCFFFIWRRRRKFVGYLSDDFLIPKLNFVFLHSNKGQGMPLICVLLPWTGIIVGTQGCIRGILSITPSLLQLPDGVNEIMSLSSGF